MEQYPVLLGNRLFRQNELIHVNRSDELAEYCGVMHKHDFIEIAYVISGSGIHIVDKERYLTVTGDLFIINADVPHGFFPKDEKAEAPVVYNCIFRPEFLDTGLFASSHFEDITSSFLFKSLFPQEYLPEPDLKLNGVVFQEIGELFQKMYNEYKQMQKGYSDLLRAYLIELIIKVFRHLQAVEPATRQKGSKRAIQSAIEYLKENYNSDIKLEELAMKSFISKNYFSRLFREVTGINLSDYVQKLRVNEACSLLLTTDMKVIDVALQVGFRDLKFFYEVFRKLTGKTPGEYRKNV